MDEVNQDPDTGENSERVSSRETSNLDPNLQLS